MAAARDYQRLREINVLLIKTTWAGGRNRQLCCVSEPVSDLSLDSSNPEDRQIY